MALYHTRARHRLLLATITQELDPESDNYRNFIEHFKGYVPRGLLATKRNLLEKFEALETKGHLGPGRYEVLKKIIKDSGNYALLKLTEEAEDHYRHIDTIKAEIHNENRPENEHIYASTINEEVSGVSQLLTDDSLIIGAEESFGNIPSPPEAVLIEEQDSENLSRHHAGPIGEEFITDKRARQKSFSKRMKTSEIGLDPDIYKDYLSAIQEGKEEDTSIRLMIIGCFGQGKTTLARRLMSHSIEGVESTNGIDIYNLSYEQDENEWKKRVEENPLKETMKRLAVASLTRTGDRETENQDMGVGDKGATKSEVIYSRITPTINAMPFVTKDEYSTISTQNLMNGPVVKYGLAIFQKLKQENVESNNAARTHKMSLWDFGGQFVFYATHQLFHSRNAVYLLVFDLHKDLNSPVIDEDFPDGTHPAVKTMKDYIEFWVTSVHSYVGNKDSTLPQIILVGTHKDKLIDEDEAEKYVERVRQMFDGRKLENHIHEDWFAVAGKDLADDEVNRLRKKIVEIGMRRNKEFLPASWMFLEYALRQRQNIVKFEDVLKLDKELGSLIGSEHKMKSFLKFHHTRGTYIYFDEGDLAEFVVLKPEFIVEAFKCILTSGKFCRKDKTLRPLWRTLVMEAKLKPELVNDIWSFEGNKNFIQFKDDLLAILKRHKIISEAMKYDDNTGQLSPRGYYIVPSFLRKSRQNEIEEFIGNRRCTTVSLVYVFENEAVVTTVYQRITGAAVGSWDVVELNGSNLLFENAGVYFLDQKNYAGVISFAENKVELLICPLCVEENIEPEVTDFFRRFVENVIQNEFKKLQSSGGRDDGPFKMSVRCQHPYHCCTGSKSLHDLEELKDLLKNQSKKIVRCPDNVAHESINIERILYEWFSHNIIVEEVRKDLLTRQELNLLSTAIGSEWKILAGLLGLHQVDIDHIEEENLRMPVRILEMLGKWQKEKEDLATLDVLVKEIKKLSPDTVKIEVVKNVINKIN